MKKSFFNRNKMSSKNYRHLVTATNNAFSLSLYSLSSLSIPFPGKHFTKRIENRE
jgi:hypothetical protein